MSITSATDSYTVVLLSGTEIARSGAQGCSDKNEVDCFVLLFTYIVSNSKELKTCLCFFDVILCYFRSNSPLPASICVNSCTVKCVCVSVCVALWNRVVILFLSRQSHWSDSMCSSLLSLSLFRRIFFGELSKNRYRLFAGSIFSTIVAAMKPFLA